jgi:hypothetical protein
MSKSLSLRTFALPRRALQLAGIAALLALVLPPLLPALVAAPAAQVRAGQQIDPGGIPFLGDEERAAIVDSVAFTLREYYVFPAKGDEMATLVEEKLAAGDYDEFVSPIPFADQLTEDIISVTGDRHLGVRFVPASQLREEETLGEEELHERRLAELRARNFGFVKLERLQGNIGYLDLRQFADARDAGETAVAAMNFLAWTDAIIFDLRQNGGGSPSMIQLISSYLFEEPVHLNSFYIRADDSMKQFWTQAQVIGPRMVDKPVYVLTSNYTFSGAEEFSYNLKNLERATLIGETTGGGAHPVQGHVFPDLSISMRVPFGRAVNPITGTNWEGTGVEPHIAVPADEALEVAQIEALKVLRDAAETPAERAPLEWALSGLEAKRNPVALDKGEMKRYVGSYGPRKIHLEDGELYYQREDRPRFRMIPMGEHTFMLDGLDFFRLRFERVGKRAELVVGLYEGGRQDANERTGK